MSIELVGTRKELNEWKKKSFFYNFGTMKMILFCIVAIGLTNTIVTNHRINKEEELNKRFIESLNYTKELYKNDYRKLAQAMDALMKKEVN